MNPQGETSDSPVVVLIVEGSPTQAEQLKHLLETRGFKVWAATSGRQALTLAHEQKPTVVVSDTVMPEMDGYTLCKEIKAHEELKGVPVILVTELTSPEDVIRGLECGADSFVRKPYESRYLLSRIDYALANRQLGDRTKKHLGVEVSFSGRKHIITSERQQILDLLISTYEEAVYMDQELKGKQEELQRSYEQLENKVQERTSALEVEIAERKRAEEALRLSEERFRKVFDEGPVGMMLVGSDLRIISANGALCRMLNYTAQELAGTAVSEITHPEDVGESLEEVRRLFAGEIPGYWIQKRYLTKSSSVLWVNLTASVIRGGKGEPLFALGIIEDVTERKRAENELRQSEEQFRLIAENVADLIVVLDLEGRRLYNSPSYKGLIGEPDAMRGTLSFNEIHPDDREKIKQVFRETVRTGRGQRAEFRFLLPNGSVRFIESQGSTIRDEAGKLIRVLVVSRDVTERKQAEEALRESEEKFRGIFEGAAEGILVSNFETQKFVYANPAVCRMLGYTGEELVHMGLSDLHPQQDLEGVVAGFMAQTRGEKTLAPAIPCLCKDGTTIYAEINASRLEVDGKDCCVAFFTDVTERGRAEEALRTSEERYRTLFRGAAEGILVADVETKKFMYANPAVCRMLGYTEEEVVRLGVNDIHPPEDLERVVAEFTAQARGEKTMASALPCLRKDGTTIYADITSTPAVIDGKNCNVGFFSDITERKRTEEEVRKLSRAVEQSPVSVMITDREGNIEYVNPKFTQLTGYTLEEVRGQKPRILKSGETPPEEYRKLWEAITSGGEWWGEFHNKRKDGTLFWERASISPIRDPSGTITHFLGVKEDITAHKLLEEQFVQAQKMEAVGRLAGGVAHDFNNLLTVINGYSHLLLERLDADSLYRGPVAEIQKAGERAASLTRQLLTFSRRQIVAPKVIDLNATVSGIEQMLRRLIGEDVDLATVLHPSLGKVKADPGQIEQVLTNLVVNARDAMPQGGRLMIETANVELDEAYTQTHYGARPGRFVMLAVSDSGHGMDTETRSHVFEPFFTTKEAGKGTGLGLATVYGIVKQGAGYIMVYSEPGEGTVVKIYLPRVEEAGAVEEEPQPSGPAPGGNETILVTEDQEAVRVLVCEVLKSKGYKVLEASRGVEALPMAREYPGPIHLLVTDVVMPGMSGRELARTLASLHPEIKVLYMSGYTDNAIVHHGVLEEGLAFIQKPFTPEALAHKVREVLGEHGSL